MRALLSILTLVFSFAAGSGTVCADEASHRKATQDLFKQMDMASMMSATLDTMLKAQLEVNPGLAPVQGTVREFLNKYIGWKALEADFVALYMRTFTERELTEILTFYRTPVGQKTLREMPKLMQAGAQLGQQRLQEHMPELQRALQEREKNADKPASKSAGAPPATK